ncbi:hypothetical protein [Sphingobacterium humi]|nr:hypothetical protein [Sphingobacterium humi]
MIAFVQRINLTYDICPFGILGFGLVIEVFYKGFDKNIDHTLFW